MTAARKNKMKDTEYKILECRVIAVAVKGAVGDWAAYIGSVAGQDHQNEWQEVKANGEKLSQSIAEVMFPEWKKLRYRQ